MSQRKLFTVILRYTVRTQLSSNRQDGLILPVMLLRQSRLPFHRGHQDREFVPA